MSDITDHLHDDIKRLKLKRYYKERICMKPISKNIKGEFDVVDHERQHCDEPDCVTLKVRVKFRNTVRSHQPCDSRAAQTLDGAMEGDMVFAYIRGGRRRGWHLGRFEWNGQHSVAIGRLRGMTNVGTHRRPFAHCEECHEPGHMEGCLDAVIVKGKHKGCRIKATYMINFDASSHPQDSHFVGAIEGVLICDCEDHRHHGHHDDDHDDDDHD